MYGLLLGTRHTQRGSLAIFATEIPQNTTMKIQATPERVEPHSVKPLDLQGPEQRLGDSIVPAIALAAH